MNVGVVEDVSHSHSVRPCGLHSTKERRGAQEKKTVPDGEDPHVRDDDVVNVRKDGMVVHRRKAPSVGGEVGVDGQKMMLRQRSPSVGDVKRTK